VGSISIVAKFARFHGAELLLVEQRYYLMMDFIDGATLEALAVEYSKQRGRPLPEADCIEWIAQVASAVRSLHRLGVVHRDIKPDNITIRAEDNAALLLDFGLTKKVEEAGAYGTTRQSGTGRFGTPATARSVRKSRPTPVRAPTFTHWA
jgi:serine/threonine protein kinase